MRFLPRIVAETKIGKSVNLVVWRDGREVTLTVTLGELDETSEVADAKNPANQKEPAKEEGEPLFGMSLKKLDESLRGRLSLDASIKGGVVVLSVDRASAAAKRGIRNGDIIIGVKQQSITSVPELKAAFAAAKSAGYKFALVRVWRDGEATFVTLPTGEK
jgi:serine protease Do